MATNVPVRESIEISEGKHTGKITKIEVRTDPYDYVDLFVELDDVKDSKGNAGTIKDGCPLGISQRSKLGRTIMRFGCEESEILEKAKSGEEINIEPYLLEKKVDLMTKNQETKQGTFARIVEDSLKPLPE